MLPVFAKDHPLRIADFLKLSTRIEHFNQGYPTSLSNYFDQLFRGEAAHVLIFDNGQYMGVACKYEAIYRVKKCAQALDMRISEAIEAGVMVATETNPDRQTFPRLTTLPINPK